MNSETTEWEEYRSKKYRFKIRHPKSLYPWEYDVGSTIFFKKYGDGLPTNVIILCYPKAQKDMTPGDLFQQILRHIAKDRRISLKVLKISNGTVDAVELVEHEVELNPEYSKAIYIQFLKDNVKFYLTWHGQDKEFLEDTGLFYKMVDSFEFC